MPGPRKKKIRLGPGAPEMEGAVVPFQTVVENFNEYLLSDGTVLNMKVVVTEIVRLDNAYDDQGQPVYFINSQNVTSISVPEELMRRRDGEASSEDEA
jgi:hypothetical protein